MSNRLMTTLAFREGVSFASGRGSYLVTGEGEEYLDFFADVGTASLGYNSPQQRRVMERMLSAGTPFHAPNLFHNGPRSAAAAMLCVSTQMDKVFFCNSGTEAAEAAIKLARKYQHDRGRKDFDIWTYKGGFHGRTYGSLAAGDGPPHHYDGFGPLPQGFGHFTEVDDIPWHTPPAAVMMAPVFGNNDVREYDGEFWEQLQRRCYETDTLLIFDEVQTGNGRSGHMTYAQRLGIKPDIIAMAKGIAMGAPVGACLAREEVAAAFTPGSHFSTFGGNPLSCCSVIGMQNWLRDQIISEDGRPTTNMQEISRKGELIRACLRELPWAHNVRGPGMLIAFDLKDRDGIEFSKACLKHKLLIGAFRTGPGPVKVTPPLNTPDETIVKGLNAMERAYHDCSP